MKTAKANKGFGEENSQFGTCWIHHVEKRLSKKVKKEELFVWIQDGWIFGRKMFRNVQSINNEQLEKTNNVNLQSSLPT